MRTDFLESRTEIVRGRMLFVVEDTADSVWYFQTAIEANAKFAGAFDLDDCDLDSEVTA